MKKHLKNLVASLLEKPSRPFVPGDLVEWKPGLKNRKSGGPMVVVQVLDAPLLDAGTDDSGYPTFREPLDIIVGKMANEDPDGDLLCYHLDSRRLQHAAE